MTPSNDPTPPHFLADATREVSATDNIQVEIVVQNNPRGPLALLAVRLQDRETPYGTRRCRAIAKLWSNGKTVRLDEWREEQDLGEGRWLATGTTCKPPLRPDALTHIVQAVMRHLAAGQQV